MYRIFKRCGYVSRPTSSRLESFGFKDKIELKQLSVTSAKDSFLSLSIIWKRARRRWTLVTSRTMIIRRQLSEVLISMLNRRTTYDITDKRRISHSENIKSVNTFIIILPFYILYSIVRVINNIRKSNFWAIFFEHCKLDILYLPKSNFIIDKE